MRSSEQRGAAYAAKTTPATVGLIVAARLDNMPSAYAAYTNDVIESQGQVVQILDAAAVLRIARGPYHAANLEMWKAKAQTSGPALAKEIQNIYDKWVARGCAALTVAEMALEIYGVTVTP